MKNAQMAESPVSTAYPLQLKIIINKASGFFSNKFGSFLQPGGVESPRLREFVGEKNQICWRNNLLENKSKFFGEKTFSDK
jgi:hypothetical protein